jgi:hypothetical protein
MQRRESHPSRLRSQTESSGSVWILPGGLPRYPAPSPAMKSRRRILDTSPWISAGRFPAMGASVGCVHSNKKTVVYYELPRPTDIRRPPLACSSQWTSGNVSRCRHPRRPPDGAKWIGIGGARLSLVCFVPHNWPRRWIGATRNLVGVAGFEPASPSSRTRCATRRRYATILLTPCASTTRRDRSESYSCNNQVHL